MSEILHKNSKSILKEKDNSETIKIESKNYIIYLNKDKNNSYIIISVSSNHKNDKDNINHKKKILDFSLIHNYFIKFKGRIPLIFKYLERMLICKLFCINNNNGNLIFTLYCLEENKNINIDIIIPNKYFVNEINISNKDKNQLGNVQSNLNNSNIKKSFKNRNLGPAPIVGDKNNIIINPNDKNKFFYYKTKIKKIEYYIYLYKNEYIQKNYKEIVFKIIEKNELNDIGIVNEDVEYYAYLNLVNFFNLSEFYFSLFNYSIDDIYEDILIILENHNYKIEKKDNKLKINIKIFSLSPRNNVCYSDIYILALKYEKEREEREINNKIELYFNEIKNYIKKFGDNFNNKIIKNLINNPNKTINNLVINKENVCGDNSNLDNKLYNKNISIIKI